jgi:YidC/Oxa1 family membrane protein insertase
MDRNTLVRWVVIAAAILLFMKFGMPLIRGGDKPQSVPAETYVNAPGYAPDILDPRTDGKPVEAPAEGELCEIAGARFDATLSTRGAGIVHFNLKDPQYAGSGGFDMSTTPDHERWRSLRTLFRAEGANDQVKFDRFAWKLERLENKKGCVFTYQDELVQIKKTVRTNERPFELEVKTEVKNLAAEPKGHRLSIGMFAFRRNEEVKGHLGRVSPFQTELSCAQGKDVTRKNKDDFKEGWQTVQGIDRYAAISNSYFGQAIVPTVEGGPADCAMLAEDWMADGQARDDDKAGAVYHSNLLYPTRKLGPNESATYTQVAFFGPKERDVLAGAARSASVAPLAGDPKLGELINLGFFSPVAKVLISFLVFLHAKVTFGNWGLAIILMTLCVRLVLFPLTWKSIKATVGMRKLKPEVDAINAKFADDAQAKNLAMMELWKKHGVNPFGGCLPQLVQMPVWFAMYTTLQTAVEMYHEKFLWFQDLSAPDRFYVLPLVLGGFMILQQRIVPQQPGMDPAQQKMMMWLMPGIFTVMMLFLPAALGVYMLTNSILGIVQQLAVEKFAPSGGGKVAKKGEISVEEVPSSKVEMGKGKA